VDVMLAWLEVSGGVLRAVEAEGKPYLMPPTTNGGS
jgi:hypothetical protein